MRRARKEREERMLRRVRQGGSGKGRGGGKGKKKVESCDACSSRSLAAPGKWLSDTCLFLPFSDVSSACATLRLQGLGQRMISLQPYLCIFRYSSVNNLSPLPTIFPTVTFPFGHVSLRTFSFPFGHYHPYILTSLVVSDG